MPLIWERNEDEDEIVVQSRKNPDKRFVVQETTSSLVYYLDGVKCGAMKPFKVIKEKSKPYKPWSSDVYYWYNEKQISFDFMHPLSKHHLLAKPFKSILSFVDKQLSLGI